MKQPFRTYSSAGLLAGSLAALCFAIQAHFNAVIGGQPAWARILSTFGPAASFMLPGLLLKPSWGRVFRFAVGSFFGGTLLLLVRGSLMVNYGGLPPVPWPDLGSYGRYYLAALCIIGLIGTFYLSGQKDSWGVKTISPFVGCVFLGLLGYMSARILPEEIVLMEKWEFVTVVFGGPLFGLVVWGALDLPPDNKKAEQEDSGDI